MRVGFLRFETVFRRVLAQLSWLGLEATDFASNSPPSPPGPVFDQYRYQLTEGNRLTGKFFFSNQPSRNPLDNGTALSRFETEEKTEQRTFSLTDVQIFSPSVINEFRAEFFRNNNSSFAVPYFTNAEVGIINPLASVRPDLSHIEIRGSLDVGDNFYIGTPADDTRRRPEYV